MGETPESAAKASAVALAAGKELQGFLADLNKLPLKAETVRDEAANWAADAADAVTLQAAEFAADEADYAAQTIGRTSIRKTKTQEGRPATGLVKEAEALFRKIQARRRTIDQASNGAAGDDRAEVVCDEWRAIATAAEGDASEILGTIEDASDAVWESAEEAAEIHVCRKCEQLLRGDLDKGMWVQCGCGARMAAMLADLGCYVADPEAVRIGHLLESEEEHLQVAGQLALAGLWDEAAEHQAPQGEPADAIAADTVPVEVAPAPAPVSVSEARAAAEEWPDAMIPRSVDQEYEGENRHSALLSDLMVCRERFPLRFECPDGTWKGSDFTPNGPAYTVTLPTGPVAGTWAEVTAAAAAHVINHRPAAVVAAAAERKEAHDQLSAFAADRTEFDTIGLVNLATVRRLAQDVTARCNAVIDHGVSDEMQELAWHLTGEVKRALREAETAYKGRSYGWWNVARTSAAVAYRTAQRAQAQQPSAAEIATAVPDAPTLPVSPERSVPSEWLLKITRPASDQATPPQTAPTATAPAPEATGADGRTDRWQAQEPVAHAAANGAPRNLGALRRKAEERGWECSVQRDGQRWSLTMKGLWLAPTGRGDLGMADVVAEAVWCGKTWESGSLGRVSPEGTVTVVRPDYGYRDMTARIEDNTWTLVDRQDERERRTANGRDSAHWVQVTKERSASATAARKRAQVALDAVTARRGEAPWVSEAQAEGAPHYRATYRIARRARDMAQALAAELTVADRDGAAHDARRAYEVAGRAAALAKAAAAAAERLERALLAVEAETLFTPLLDQAQADAEQRDAERLAAAPAMTLETFLERVRGILPHYVREYAEYPVFEGVPREQWGAVFDAERARRFQPSTAEGDVTHGLWDARDRAVFALAAATGHADVAAEGRALDAPRATVKIGDRSRVADRAWKAISGDRRGLSALHPARDVLSLDAMLRDGRVPHGPEAAEVRRALLLMVADENRREARSQARDVMEEWERRRSAQPQDVNVAARLWALAAGCGPAETYRRELRAGWARIEWFRAAHPCPVVQVDGYRVTVTPVAEDVSAGMLAHRAAQRLSAAAAEPTGEADDPEFPRWVAGRSTREIEWGIRQRAERPAQEREKDATAARAEAAQCAQRWLNEVLPGPVVGGHAETNNAGDGDEIPRNLPPEAPVPAKVPDVISAPGLQVWGDEGGYCPGVETPQPAGAAGEPATSADIEITHTPADGTQVHGTERGDEAGKILSRKEYGRRGGMKFKWCSDLECWILYHSRDDDAHTWTINKLQQYLEEAGYTVDVTIDNDIERSVAEAEAERAGRALDRTARYEEYAGNAAARSEGAHRSAHAIADVIPPGQPVLVGHHSERGHRRALSRMDGHMRRSIDEDRKAKHWAERAASAANFQAYREDPHRTLRRLEGLNKELRDIAKWKRGQSACGYTRSTTPEGLAKLAREERRARARVAYWEGIVAQAEADGLKIWRPEDFRKGDWVNTGGTWREVVRVSKKSLTVPSASWTGRAYLAKADLDGTEWEGRTGTCPYDRVTGRATAAEVAQWQAAAPGELTKCAHCARVAGKELRYSEARHSCTVCGHAAGRTFVPRPPEEEAKPKAAAKPRRKGDPRTPKRLHLECGWDASAATLTWLDGRGRPHPAHPATTLTPPDGGTYADSVHSTVLRGQVREALAERGLKLRTRGTGGPGKGVAWALEAVTAPQDPATPAHTAPEPEETSNAPEAAATPEQVPHSSPTSQHTAPVMVGGCCSCGAAIEQPLHGPRPACSHEGETRPGGAVVVGGYACKPAGVGRCFNDRHDIDEVLLWSARNTAPQCAECVSANLGVDSEALPAHPQAHEVEEAGEVCASCGRGMQSDRAAAELTAECTASHWLYCTRRPAGAETAADEAQHVCEITEAAGGGGFNGRCSCNGLHTWARSRDTVADDVAEHLAQHGVAPANEEEHSTAPAKAEDAPETEYAPAQELNPDEVAAQFAQRLTAALGAGWSLQPNADGITVHHITHTDGRSIALAGISNGWDSKGRSRPPERVNIWGRYPKTERTYKNGERPAMTAGIDQGPEKVARRIGGKRFMDRYQQTLETVRAYNTARAVDQAELERLGRMVGDVFTAGSVIKASPWTCEVISRRNGRNLQAKVYQRRVSMELGYMPVDVARAVAVAYNDGMARHHAEHLTDTTSDPGSTDQWEDEGGAPLHPNAEPAPEPHPGPQPAAVNPTKGRKNDTAPAEAAPALRWEDGPALVFIASRRSAPTRARALWVVTRQEAQRLCSHQATSGRSFMLAWTERPGVEGVDWEFIRDTGSFDAVLVQLGVEPRRKWVLAEVERFPESCPRCHDRAYVRGQACAACPTFGRSRHERVNVVQAAAKASLQPAIEAAPVRAALPAPRYTKGQRVIVTPEPIAALGSTVQGLKWRGTFGGYETYGRAWVCKHGEHSPVIVPARQVTADASPPEHETRVFTMPGDGSRTQRAGYDPTLDMTACVKCSCGWSATAPENNWSACVGWGRAHVEATKAEPKRVIAPPYAAPPRVFAMPPSPEAEPTSTAPSVAETAHTYAVTARGAGRLAHLLEAAQRDCEGCGAEPGTKCLPNCLPDPNMVAPAPAAYHVAITDYDESQQERTYTAAEADLLLDVAMLQDDQLIIADDHSGRIAVTRILTGPRSATNPTLVTKRKITTLTPLRSPRLTSSQYELLSEVQTWNNDHPSRSAQLTDSGHIASGFTAITPVAARRLVDGGWVALTANDAVDDAVQHVDVSYAGRIATALHEHRTRGNGIVNHEPDWGKNPGNSVYVASCSCGWYGPQSDDAAITRGHARNHRHEQVQAAIGI
ncbi:DUF3560 domain-containing protein [Streptomyces sp. NPDC059101]|uniref:DUF3560 domain-containing protein n=1 Tax=Streptomyces sp. NPDC059101 TaxID=3346728 RepID=UPI00369F692D